MDEVDELWRVRALGYDHTEYEGNYSDCVRWITLEFDRPAPTVFILERIGELCPPPPPPLPHCERARPSTTVTAPGVL